MFTPKQLKTIKKAIIEEEELSAGKSSKPSFHHNLILATERLQEIYHNTCGNGLSRRNLPLSDNKENISLKARKGSKVKTARQRIKKKKYLQSQEGADREQFSTQITQVLEENEKLKLELLKRDQESEINKKQLHLKKKKIERLRSLENDVKKHRIIEETWMKCKASLLEQNKVLLDELNRVQKRKKSKSKSRKRNCGGKSILPSRKGQSSRSKSKSHSLEKNKRHTKSMMFEVRNGSRQSLISNKWSVNRNTYNSGALTPETPAPVKYESNFPSSRVQTEIHPTKNKYLETFGKKQQDSAEFDDEEYTPVDFLEYSKSNHDDTPDFDQLPQEPERQNRDGSLDMDMVILGYQTNIGKLQSVSFN